MIHRALLDRARLLCAHATFIAPSGALSLYDAGKRHPLVQQVRRTLAILKALTP